ncbi:nuclear fragile X mental retardation-interacting protein 1-like [Mizuhopecten yessoensis]|uniref:Nuclear fragile X mental retardation-interacting protein 1 n=1 Tax=Mizuhopecten yessoensis TaxID=6573 RepID=A0A210QGJ7_MIZYE|nr:nuclear fragile X mental retardation-interacting protein 1-like [Mizuhopecten yessoensis]OWF47893.1 Nuclear fragile X mental retardation-interacting protein 1 [Mizuhopecten yessoensis]
MSGPRFPWRGGGGMNGNPWGMGQFSPPPPPGPRPPMMRGQGPNNWRSPNSRPIIRYDMGPFDMAPRGMRPGFFPNSAPHMMNMSGCRPPNPERFKQGHIQKAQGQDGDQEMKSLGQSHQTQNFGRNMANGPSNNFRGNFQNGENYNGKRFPGNGTFNQQNTGSGQSGDHLKNKQFQGNWNQNKKPKKQKIDKRELPENNKFSCDICERGFKTEEKYKEHVDGHTKCTYEDCSYVAAPKLVQLHIRMQHYSGLAKKIWTLDSKEDIEKWRAERKKHFPTAENIAKRRVQSAEMKARGEVLETKQFGKMKGQNRNQGQQKNRQNRRKRRGQRSGDSNEEDAKKARVDTDVSEVKNSTGVELEKPDIVPPATGDPLSVLLTDAESDCDNEEMTRVAKPVGDVADGETESGLQGGLGMILSSYSADTVLDSTCDKNTTSEQSPKQNKKRGDNSRKNNRRNNQTKAGKNKWKNNKLFNNTKSSLLEKLLSKEIRHERNVILQCVYYIVKNNFLETGQSTSSRSIRDSWKDRRGNVTPSVGSFIDDDACM